MKFAVTLGLAALFIGLGMQLDSVLCMWIGGVFLVLAIVLFTYLVGADEAILRDAYWGKQPKEDNLVDHFEDAIEDRRIALFFHPEVDGETKPIKLSPETRARIYREMNQSIYRKH